MVERVAADLAGRGRCGYVIPEGGSNHIGALGYVACVAELLQQANQQDNKHQAGIIGSDDFPTQVSECETYGYQPQ